MKALSRLRLYFKAPKPSEIELTTEEMVWWNNISGPIQSRTVRNAFIAVSLGMGAGILIARLIGMITGAVSEPRMRTFNIVFTFIMGGIATAFASNTLLTAKRKEMVRSRRLLNAMKDESPNDAVT